MMKLGLLSHWLWMCLETDVEVMNDLVLDFGGGLYESNGLDSISIAALCIHGIWMLTHL